MKRILLTMIMTAVAICTQAVGIESEADSLDNGLRTSHENDAPKDKIIKRSVYDSIPAAVEAKGERVIVGTDTVWTIIPERNFGRYDRGLFNYLYIPRGQWAFGLTASYGEFNTDDVQVLSMLKNIDFKGKLYSLNPSVSYFIRNNQSIGMKLNYTRGEANLENLVLDFDEDMNFSLHDVSYATQSYAVSVFYRNYIGLSEGKRFAVFNEVDLAFSSGSSRFKRYYDDKPRDTRTTSTGVSLNFSPGVCVFIMDNVAFNVSFGVFGLKLAREHQTTNGIDEGSRTASGANFKFNIFNINFGMAIVI